jgi:hypothetical protein
VQLNNLINDVQQASKKRVQAEKRVVPCFQCRLKRNTLLIMTNYTTAEPKQGLSFSKKTL